MAKLPFVLDVLFYGAAAALLSAGVLRYFRVPLALALLAGALIGIAAGGMCALLLLWRGRKKFLTKEARERRERLLLHLALEREERVRALLAKALAANGKETSFDEDGVIADGERIVPLFRMQPLSADAAALLLRKFGETPFTLACNEPSPEAERLLFSFGRKIWKKDEIADLLERTGTVPETLICGSIPRPKARARLKRAFCKRNARPFAVSGALLLVMSLFTLFPLYDLIAGGLLLLTAAVVRAAGTA